MDAYKSLGFIGAGNMSQAIITGLIANGYPANKIFASNRSIEKLNLLQSQYNIHTSLDNEVIATQAEIIILAVKPQVLPKVTEALKPVFAQTKPLIISVAAGITIDKLAKYCGENLAIIRSMPNTPAAIQQGITGLYANQWVNAEQHKLAEQIMGAIGQIIWAKQEDDINKINAISGSGPAYFFYFMEALQIAGEAIGLDPETTNQLVLQTGLGAAMLAKKSDISFSQLRQQVTSPGGTTEQALKVFEQQKLVEITEQAVQACLKKAQAF